VLESLLMNGRERILALLDGQPIDRTPLMPITMMYAADHIGQPYGRYATDFRVLVEGQTQTAEAYAFDYVSCISDPAREAADCGADVQLFDDQPPAINEMNALLADKATLKNLEIPDPLLSGGRMHDRVQAAALFRQQDGGGRLIEGWIEGPCAESADLRGINTLMLDFYDDPGFVHELFEFVLQMGLRFARAQIEAGVDLMGVGDAAASLVGPQIYRDFVWAYEKRLVDGLHDMGCKVRSAHLRQHQPDPGAHRPPGLRHRRSGFFRAGGRCARRWGPSRCCWAICIRSACCATARPRRSKQRSPSAIARRGRATSSAPVAKCLAAPRTKTCLALTRYALSTSV
jgi:uroporphyrinogen-III decarboxylase